MLLRGCREPTPYTAPAAPAPCGDGQKFHSGRACPRGGGQWARGERIHDTGRGSGGERWAHKASAEFFWFCFVFWSLFVL